MNSHNQLLLNKLQQRLAELEEKVQCHDRALSAHDKKWLANRSRFHDQLFEQHGATLDECIQVLKRDLAQIQQLVQIDVHSDTLALACQRFTNRYQALLQAMENTNTITRGLQQTEFKRKQPKQQGEYQWIAQSVMQSSHQLYQELKKHQNWEQQLEHKADALEHELERYQGSEKIAQQNLILHTRKRLGKCRQAMSYIEQRIAYLERTKD